MSVSFSELSLNKHLLSTVAAEGYQTATPIQAKAIPIVLAGRDVLGCAQTGTGKTAAFSLPILQRLGIDAPATGNGRRRIRGLILAPTRELASQIADSLKTYGRGLPVRHVVIFGGVGQSPQVQALRNGVDVVIATPGRLMDLMGQGHVDLGAVEVFVLDEADRMLDMGFIPDIRKIAAKLPAERQTLLFSATMPAAIAQLARSLLRNPERVEVVPQATTAERIRQCVYHVEKANKPALLSHLVKRDEIDRALVFTRTKHGADRVVKQLARFGLPAVAIHGNKSQNNRQRALDGFKGGRVRLLIATDVAARGIDVDGISHVFNYDVTHEPETYVHRIGRTARAGASGTAVSFCDRDERANLRAIEKLIKQAIEVKDDVPTFLAQPSPDEALAPAREARAERRPQRRDGRISEQPRQARADRPAAQQADRMPQAGRRQQDPKPALAKAGHPLAAKGSRPGRGAAARQEVGKPRRAGGGSVFGHVVRDKKLGDRGRKTVARSR